MAVDQQARAAKAPGDQPRRVVAPPRAEFFEWQEGKGFTVQASPLRRVLEFAGSLRVAVILLVLLAAILTVTTIVESREGTDFARRVVYTSAWFHVLMILLAVNVLASALVRWPFRLHHTGFLVTHGGIVVLLVGALVNLIVGHEGIMVLWEGESSSYYAGQDSQIVVRDDQGQEIAVLPGAEFERPGRLSVPLALGASGAELVVEGFVRHANVTTRLAPVTGETAGEPGRPAVGLRLLMPGPNGNFNKLRDWTVLRLFAGGESSPRSREDWGWMETVRFDTAESPEELEQLLTRTQLDWGELVLDIPGRSKSVRIPIDQAVESVVPIADTGWKLSVLERHEHSHAPQAVADGFHNHFEWNPDLDFEILDGSGESSKGSIQLRSSAGAIEVGEGIMVRVEGAVVPQGGPRLDLVLDAKGELYYAAAAAGAKPVMGKVQTSRRSRAMPLPWGGAYFAVTEYGPAMIYSRSMRPAPREERDRYPSGVAMRVRDGDKRTRQILLYTNDEREVRLGEKSWHVEYRQTRVEVPFAVELKQANTIRYPGSMQSKEFQSLVVMRDAERGIQREVLISMNQPLVHRGYKLFQESMKEHPRFGPNRSGLRVTKYPGTMVVYIGSFLIVLGAILVFWGGPLGRQATTRGTR